MENGWKPGRIRASPLELVLISGVTAIAAPFFIRFWQGLSLFSFCQENEKMMHFFEISDDGVTFSLQPSSLSKVDKGTPWQNPWKFCDSTPRFTVCGIYLLDVKNGTSKMDDFWLESLITPVENRLKLITKSWGFVWGPTLKEMLCFSYHFEGFSDEIFFRKPRPTERFQIMSIGRCNKEVMVPENCQFWAKCLQKSNLIFFKNMTK